MVKESMGPADPQDLADLDQDGVSDRAEEEFAETAKIQPAPSDGSQATRKRSTQAATPVEDLPLTTPGSSN